MKKIPYGIINYEKLITENYVYVDKTPYLEKLENNKSTLFYLRPGRFGKSLFTSMMYYYYDVNSKDKFDTLFKDTYVYNNPTPNKNNYYCLKFDFSNITTANKTDEMLEQGFYRKVVDGINNFNIDYSYNFKIDEKLNSNELLLSFLSFFKSLQLAHKLYILIDEYDNFTNAIFEGDASKFLGAVGNAGFVKSFYAVIKEYIGLGVIDRFFATGICPITLNSMTTGFNIASDLSTDVEFDAMIGLTHEEVQTLLSEYSEEERNNIFKVMIENYDGYLFSDKLKDEDRTFNATLVMYFLDYYERFHEIPDSLFDNNITVNYGKIDSLLKLQNNSLYYEIIDKLLKTNEIEARLVTQFNLLEDITRDGIISLLYYFGYLTVKEKEEYTSNLIFKVPNRAMLETYNNYFIKMLSDQNILIDNTLEKEYIKEIVELGQVNKVTEYVSKLIEMINNKNYVGFNEKNVKLIYLTLLLRNKFIRVYDEFPSRDGYADLLILRNNELAKYDILIEFKYIKKEEYSESLLESKKEEAKEQLKYYENDERIDKNVLKKYVVIFVASEVKVLEEVK